MLKFNLQEQSDANICIKDTQAKDITIGNCKNCSIYILKEIVNISFTDITDCIVFISKCNKMNVINSTQSKFTTFSSQLQIENSKDSTFFLFTLNPTIIKNKSTGIAVGPYNAAHKSFTIPNGNNLWDKYNVEQGSQAYILDPHDFEPFAIPFGEEPNGIVSTIPPTYSQALAQREKVSEERRKLAMEFCQRAPAYASQFRERIAEAFRSTQKQRSVYLTY